MTKHLPPSITSPQTETTKAHGYAQAMVDNLNRNVLAEHEKDLAMLPPEVRVSKTPEQWLATPPLEILKLAREAKNNRR
jgi:hypothetical protein